MKKTTRLALLAVGGIVLILFFFDVLYIVSETNQVIITQFGEPMGGTVSNPGLHIKAPMIQKANYFEKRWLEWDGDAEEITTKDKKFIWIDSYARWRISDPLIFFQRVKDERGAQSRIDDILDGATRNTVANYDLIELVRTSNREFELSEESAILDVPTEALKVEAGRDMISQLILEKASQITPEFGVELKDLKIKRLNYTNKVQDKVFDRMIAERQRIAAKYRSEGDGESARIRGQKERELKRIESGAYKTAQELMGKADGQAARIYAAAYNLDPEFYSFLKTLDTYRTTIDSNTTLLMSTDSEYFKYFKRSDR